MTSAAARNVVVVDAACLFTHRSAYDALRAANFTRPFITEVLTLLASSSRLTQLALAIRLVDSDPVRASAWLVTHRFQPRKTRKGHSA